MSPADIQLWLQLGLGGLMLMALFLGARRVWVFGWQFLLVVEDRDRWRDIALRSIGAAEKSTGVAETLAKNGTK